MCTQTNDNLENENIEEPSQGIESFPRDINVLLAMPSYATMTDEEIELVFEYKLNQARISQELLAFEASRIMAVNETIAIQEQAARDSALVLQSISDNILPPKEYRIPQSLTFNQTPISVSITPGSVSLITTEPERIQYIDPE